MATTPKLPVHQPRVDRNRSSEAPKTGRTEGADGTRADIRSTLPPIYRQDGQQDRGGDGRRGGGHNPIRGQNTGLFASVRGGPAHLFNATSPASYYEATVPAARFVELSATERYRPRWMNKYSSLGGSRRITFNSPAFSAKTPGVTENPSYDIPSEWTDQLRHGLTEARVNDVNDSRPAWFRASIYNLRRV